MCVGGRDGNRGTGERERERFVKLCIFLIKSQKKSKERKREWERGNET